MAQHHFVLRLGLDHFHTRHALILLLREERIGDEAARRPPSSLMPSAGAHEHVHVVRADDRQDDADRAEPCPPRRLVHCDRRPQLDPHVEDRKKSARLCGISRRVEKTPTDALAAPTNGCEQACNHPELRSIDSQVVASERDCFGSGASMQSYVTNNVVGGCCDESNNRRRLSQQAYVVVAGQKRRVSVRTPYVRDDVRTRVKVSVRPFAEHDCFWSPSNIVAHQGCTGCPLWVGYASAERQYTRGRRLDLY
jgi:hypothetical protein